MYKITNPEPHRTFIIDKQGRQIFLEAGETIELEYRPYEQNQALVEEIVDKVLKPKKKKQEE